MKKISIIIAVVLFSLAAFLFAGCSDSGAEVKSQSFGSVASSNKNLNITILLDLSDRISSRKNPDQFSRDTASVMAVVDMLKRNLQKKGTFNSKDRIKVVFYPNNQNQVVQGIASSLNIDFGELTTPQKREKFQQMDSIYRNNISDLYAMSSAAPVFIGSDIFNYFRHRAADDCITRDSSFTNILVIFSDGYMYHKNSQYNSGNRFSYIVPNAKHVDMFRKDFDWGTRFENEDFGFIDPGVDLNGLRILALEFSPWGDNTVDYDIMLKYWSKWFTEMNISKSDYKIVKTDVSSQNRPLIKEFFSSERRSDL